MRIENIPLKISEDSIVIKYFKHMQIGLDTHIYVKAIKSYMRLSVYKRMSGPLLLIKRAYDDMGQRFSKGENRCLLIC